VLAGETIVDAAVTVPCSIATMVLGFLTIEFITPFRPRGDELALRAPLLVYASRLRSRGSRRTITVSASPHAVALSPMTLLVRARCAIGGS
jgi:hypothetical protein